jgi:hypothetical protein
VATSTRRLLILALLLPSIGQAQERLLAHVGDRVRITAPKSGFDLITGRVVASDSALLTIRVPATRGFYYVHRGEIEAIDISASSTNGLLGGMAVGALNGIVVGIGIGAMQSTNNLGQLNFSPERRDAILCGAAGILVGGLVGLMIRNDDWVPVQMQTPASSKPLLGTNVSVNRISFGWSVSY